MVKPLKQNDEGTLGRAEQTARRGPPPLPPKKKASSIGRKACASTRWKAFRNEMDRTWWGCRHWIGARELAAGSIEAKLNSAGGS